jgi:hypothetical protein
MRGAMIGGLPYAEKKTAGLSPRRLARRSLYQKSL